MQIYKYRVLIGKWEKLGKFGKLEAGSWMLDAGCWILDAGYWMPDTGCWILDTGLDAGLDSGCRPATA